MMNKYVDEAVCVQTSAVCMAGAASYPAHPSSHLHAWSGTYSCSYVMSCEVKRCCTVMLVVACTAEVLSPEITVPASALLSFNCTEQISECSVACHWLTSIAHVQLRVNSA